MNPEKLNTTRGIWDKVIDIVGLIVILFCPIYISIFGSFAWLKEFCPIVGLLLEIMAVLIIGEAHFGRGTNLPCSVVAIVSLYCLTYALLPRFCPNEPILRFMAGLYGVIWATIGLLGIWPSKRTGTDRDGESAPPTAHEACGGEKTADKPKSQ